MFRTTLKSLAARKMRMVTTALAVTLGVAFMAGTLVLSDTVGSTFDNLFAQIGEGTDAAVRGAQTLGDSDDGGDDGEGGDGPRNLISVDLVDEIAALPGVAAVAPNTQTYAQFVDPDGEPIGGDGPPNLGFNWIDDPELNSFELVQGGRPPATGEVVIDKGTADETGYGVGDTITVVVPGGSREFTISGVVTFGGQDRPGGATVAMFDDATASEIAGTSGALQEITVRAEDGVSQAELVRTIQTVTGGTEQVITGQAYLEEEQSDIQQGLGFIKQFLLVFAGIALFVGSFVIFNTFSILVAQRGRELALLRAVGASRRQVLGSVVLEAAVTGLVASALGLVAGIGLASGLKVGMAGAGFELPEGPIVVTSGTILVALIAGVAITVAASVIPAVRASRTAPVEAMRQDSARDHSSRSRVRMAVGGFITAGGLAVAAYGLWGSLNEDAPDPAALVGMGALATVVGVSVLGPLLASIATKVLGAPIARFRGVPGELARQNAARNPRRTASTAAALMIGVALVGFITVFAASAKATIDSQVADVGADLLVDGGRGGIDPAIVGQVQGTEGVQAAAGLRFVPVTIDGEVVGLAGTDPTQLATIFDLEGAGIGDLGELSDNGLAVDSATATDRGWAVGDEIELVFLDTGAHTLTLESVYDSTEVLGGLLATTGAFEVVAPRAFDSELFVRIEDGADLAEVQRSVERLVADVPTIEVQDIAEYGDSISAGVNQILGLVYVLLAFAVVIALLGIANTLALSVHERTREVGLLRAVGMSRRQLRSSIRWESVIIALFGTGLGLAIGLGFGWATVTAAGENDDFFTFAFPGGQLAVIAVLAAGAGVLAARKPAKRAARLNILDAIHHM